MHGIGLFLENCSVSDFALNFEIPSSISSFRSSMEAASACSYDCKIDLELIWYLVYLLQMLQCYQELEFLETMEVFLYKMAT